MGKAYGIRVGFAGRLPSHPSVRAYPPGVTTVGPSREATLGSSISCPIRAPLASLTRTPLPDGPVGPGGPAGPRGPALPVGPATEPLKSFRVNDLFLTSAPVIEEFLISLPVIRWEATAVPPSRNTQARKPRRKLGALDIREAARRLNACPFGKKMGANPMAPSSSPRQRRRPALSSGGGGTVRGNR